MRRLAWLLPLLVGCGSTADLTFGAFDAAGTAWADRPALVDARTTPIPSIEMRPDPQHDERSYPVAHPPLSAVLATYRVTLRGEEPSPDTLGVTIRGGGVWFDGPRGDWSFTLEGVTNRLEVDVPFRVEQATVRVEADGFEPLEVTLEGDDARLGGWFAALRRRP